ncbi:hypothetical protein ACFWBR_17620 [Streptomyces sp. NPDC060006]|nr:hypothetical protein [Streptomyces sp. BV286]MBV1942739.1 hypothetical protein [Streptomyces sp. BV286]
MDYVTDPVCRPRFKDCSRWAHPFIALGLSHVSFGDSAELNVLLGAGQQAAGR